MTFTGGEMLVIAGGAFAFGMILTLVIVWELAIDTEMARRAELKGQLMK